MDRDDYKSAYDDLYALHDEALTKLSAAEARMKALEKVVEAARRVDHWAYTDADKYNCLRELRAALDALLAPSGGER